MMLLSSDGKKVQLRDEPPTYMGIYPDTESLNRGCLSTLLLKISMGGVESSPVVPLQFLGSDLTM